MLRQQDELIVLFKASYSTSSHAFSSMPTRNFKFPDEICEEAFTAGSQYASRPRVSTKPAWHTAHRSKLSYPPEIVHQKLFAGRGVGDFI
jgi:hypothetical protein